MILFKKSTDLHNYLDLQHKKGLRIGFVPTMGALHNGHISLIEASKKHNHITVVSIFINPTQFNVVSDFDKYPVTIEKDIDLLEQAECEVLFLPSVDEIYPNGTTLHKKYFLGDIETILEGEFRPGHYQGVCMVVHRLLEIVFPDNLYLGQKDYQQCIVVSKLIDNLGLKEKIVINISPTLREKDGLAMSSRNMRLNDKERLVAPSIFNSLSYIKENKGKINPLQLKQEANNRLIAAGLKPDYVEIADATSLLPVSDWTADQQTIALVAAYLNDIRLIDNLLLD